jgi:ATP-binding cassette subfamily B protein
MPAMMIIMNLTTVAVFWFGSLRAQNGDIGIGALMAVLEYTMHILFSFMMLSMIFVLFPRATVSAGRIAELLDRTGSMDNSLHPRRPSENKGRLEFRDVSFRYPGAEVDALSSISFSCQAGETTAIIGGTGAGKSTLVNLIPRFHDPREGSILLDGLDVREMDPEDLRSRLGIVPQKALLFSGTVAENIRYGKPDATDEELHDAAKTAQAAEFIDLLEGGYGALLAQGGINLSGGQKQRIAIARALVRDPALYIFDDSFSALDFRTDARLRAALAERHGNATKLIVAQRVGTVMNADRILVLDEGRMADQGTHTELLARCRVYREIFRSQLSADAVADAGTEPGAAAQAVPGGEVQV